MKPALTLQKREHIARTMEHARQAINSLKARTQLLDRFQRVGPNEQEFVRLALDDARNLANCATFVARLIQEFTDELEKEALS